jgi:hypothetical protein
MEHGLSSSTRLAEFAERNRVAERSPVIHRPRLRVGLVCYLTMLTGTLRDEVTCCFGKVIRSTPS